MKPIFRGKGFVYVAFLALLLAVFGASYWAITQLTTVTGTVETSE